MVIPAHVRMKPVQPIGHLATKGSASAGPGAIQSLLGTITREDGTTQVTYNGWPLYTYSGDTIPDTTNGQGAEPGWTLIALIR